MPPLDYGRVYRLKKKYPERFIGINGGVRSALMACFEHLAHIDGAAARGALPDARRQRGRDAAAFLARPSGRSTRRRCWTMSSLCPAAIAAGRLGHVARHMVGLFRNCPAPRASASPANECRQARRGARRASQGLRGGGRRRLGAAYAQQP